MSFIAHIHNFEITSLRCSCNRRLIGIRKIYFFQSVDANVLSLSLSCLSLYRIATPTIELITDLLPLLTSLSTLDLALLIYLLTELLVAKILGTFW